MRDIRDDLRERIDGAKRRHADATAAAQMAADELSMLTSLLRLEDARAAEAAPPVEGERRPGPAMSLPEFIADQISKAPMSKDELKGWAEQAGYADEGGALGRSIHAVLVNMVRSNRAMVLPDNRFTLKTMQYVAELAVKSLLPQS